MTSPIQPDLIERLNRGVIIIGQQPGSPPMYDIVTANQAMRKAATAITTLQAQLERVKEALTYARRETCISDSNGVDFNRSARMRRLREAIDEALTGLSEEGDRE